MWPSPGDPGELSWLVRSLAWAHGIGLPTSVDIATLEVLANVAMFVPLGLLIASSARTPRPWLAVPAGLVFSAIIETVQIALPGRYPTVADVVANTTGAALAAAVVVGHRAVRRRRAERVASTGGQGTTAAVTPTRD